ncbi:MAG TPA: hypothetical protein VLC47_13970, partial [Burkholderiales bacterium]|nr:hypothetical protein [Burkholderiales bacterium]
NSLDADQKRALEAGARVFFNIDAEYYTTSASTAGPRVVSQMAGSGVVVSEPDIAAFRKATLPVVVAFKNRVKSPLVDQALKEAGVE